MIAQRVRRSSTERFEAKQEKREAIQQQHCQILQEYKKTMKYYDEERDQLMKAKYYANLSKIPTYEQLHQLISKTFSHARRRSNIFPIVDRQPDYSLRCVYSGRILSNDQGIMLQKCDEQHSFPQSYQRGTKSGTGRDMHAIFAASKSANGSRGNKPFGRHSEDQKVIETSEFGYTLSGTSAIKHKTYIPKINSGAVARATLYILVCYKGCANKDYLPQQTLKWLIETAFKEQVTIWEKHRNQELYRLQGNRNPFIDYPELSKIIDFEKGWQL